MRYLFFPEPPAEAETALKIIRNAAVFSRADH